MKKSLKKYYGFTLVELIIVITILAILSTIAFVSFQNYTKSSRDANRISSLKNIENGLEIFFTKVGNYPLPDKYSTIKSSGFVTLYQGVLGEENSKLININGNIRDPKDNLDYYYSIDGKKTKYQILSYFENNDYVYKNTTFANNYESRYLRSFGSNLGMIFDNNDNLLGNTDLSTQTESSKYKIVFSNNDIVYSSGNEIFSNIYNRNQDYLNNLDLAKLDDSLLGFWDMSTLSGTELKDFSKYGNDGIIDQNTFSITGESSCKKGNCMYEKKLGFSDASNGIETKNPINFSDKDFSISLWYKRGQIKTDDEYNGVYNCIYLVSSKGYHDASTMGNFSLRSNGQNKKVIDFPVFDGTGNGEHVGSVLFDESGWVNLVLNKIGTKVNFYVNGNLVGEGNINKSIGGNLDGNKLSIGKKTYGCGMEFWMDEIRVYKRSLSKTEIVNLYELK